MIAEAVVQKDGVFIKGFKPSTYEKVITVRIEQVPSTKKQASPRGILHKYANAALMAKEAGAWKSRVKDE